MQARELFDINETKGKILFLSVGLLLIAAGMYYYFFIRGTGTTEYVTAKVTRGDIVNKVSATGTLQAVTTVQVGSQASGTISAIYADFNSVVHKGEVIAELDPASLQAQVQQAQANLDQMNANLHVAQANLNNSEAQLVAARSNVLNQRAGVSSAKGNLNSLKAEVDDAQSLLNKQKTLYSEGIIAERDLEVAQTSYKSAEAKYQQALAQVNQAQVSEQSAQDAGVAQAQASIRQMQSQIQLTKAQIKQSQAALELAKVNLSHTTITSPINGVVVSRQVDVGQTVAASLSAPTLFTIANDLTQMQALANVDEADIGAVNQASKVSFTVDAFPGQNFDGKINQIRLNSTTVQNVVTYTVVIDVSNPDQKLKPGMTTNLTFEIARRDEVIKIPNAAMRYAPQSRRSGGGGGGRGRGNANGNANQQVDSNSALANTSDDFEGPNGVAPPTSPVLPGQTRIVWTVDANKNLQPHRIKIGISDGTSTEMVEGDLKEDDVLVTGETTSGTPRAGNSQAPPGFGGAPRGPGGPGGR
jgi:HlyD family secretion protein